MGAPLNLRAQLLLIVGGPLLLLLLLESIVSYRIGTHITNQVFDRWLLDSAYSLVQEVQEHGNHVHFVADQTAIEVFEWDAIDSIYFQVLGQDGELIAGMPEIQATADIEALRLGPVFADLVFNEERTRAVSLLGLADTDNTVIVTVAETLNKRQAMIGELLFEVLLSKAVLLVAVLLIIGVAFERGLRPLVRLSKELSQRSPQELTPIELGLVPGELHGLIENTNQLLARIDAAISSREQFIGNIAHQIRTPLAGMKLQAQLAQYDADDMAAVQAALDRIVHASDHMAHVNSQLMKLARAESAFGRGLRREQVDLVALVRNCCAELTWRSHAKKIQLLQNLPDHPLVILGEMTLLTEMVSNLVENAIIYGNEKGHIWITLQDTPAGPRLEIEDDGPGIAQEHWPQIFDRFFRPNPAAGEGCGLGLSIVREIALAHGASVHLEERGKGSGIRFVVQFSVAQGVFRSEA
jgi:two-component system, OmpR family, sensor histidine kinase TctE